jgi:predicted transcriptional regulator
MKTIEEIFLETKVVFEKQAAEAIEEVMDKIYTQYLPHVESDTQSNVYFQSYDWIRKYLSDSLREDDFKIDVLSKDVRDKIWNDHKDELKELITKDVAERLADLEKIHRSDWQHKYY